MALAKTLRHRAKAVSGRERSGYRCKGGIQKTVEELITKTNDAHVLRHSPDSREAFGARLPFRW